MPSAPLISILLPVFNAGPFLKACVDSILKQEEVHWELIAVNDFSTDDSLEILRQYSRLDNRIKVLQNREKGIISALRLAYQHSKGEYITRMDADDRMAAGKLTKLQAILSEKGAGFISTGLVAYFSESQNLGAGYQAYAVWLNDLALQQKHYTEIYRECVIPSPCWMMHRKDLDRCGAFEPETYPEDYDLCFRFYQNKIQPIAVPEVLHYWRDHADRTSRNDPKYADQHFFELKVPYFLSIDFDPNRPLAIWGAGKKGKKMAQLLKQENVEFQWVCNTPSKWGHQSQGITMQSFEILKSLNKPQIIILVAAEKDKADILHYTQNNLPDSQLYFFI